MLYWKLGHLLSVIDWMCSLYNDFVSSEARKFQNYPFDKMGLFWSAFTFGVHKYLRKRVMSAHRRGDQMGFRTSVSFAPTKQCQHLNTNNNFGLKFKYSPFMMVINQMIAAKNKYRLTFNLLFCIQLDYHLHTVFTKQHKRSLVVWQKLWGTMSYKYSLKQNVC